MSVSDGFPCLRWVRGMARRRIVKGNAAGRLASDAGGRTFDAHDKTGDQLTLALPGFISGVHPNLWGEHSRGRSS